MSRNGTLLPIPEASELAELLQTRIDVWPALAASSDPWPRSTWLRSVEDVLRTFHPFASSADRKLTARHYAPFPLRDGPNVP